MRKQKHIFTLYVILPIEMTQVVEILPQRRHRTYLLYRVNIMFADDISNHDIDYV